MITAKEYYCRLCGSKRMIETNHTGSTVSGCNNCGHSHMYNVETDLANPDRPFIEVVFKYYRLDISKAGDAQYEHTCNFIREKYHSIKFDVWYDRKREVLYEKAEPRQWEKLSGEKVKLYTDCLSDNQWETSRGHLMDWHENIYANDDIKEGYYLCLPPEAIELRKATYKCSYCGNEQDHPGHCDKSKGSHPQWQVRNLYKDPVEHEG